MYFLDGNYLSRIAVGSGQRKHRVFRFPAYANGVTAYTVADGYIFWTAQDPGGTSVLVPRYPSLGPPSLGSALYRATLAGTGVTRLVGKLFFPEDVVVAGGHVYWLDLNPTSSAAIGRANLDGSDARRRFIVQPHLSLTDYQDGNDFDGLTTDGRYLYFTRCQSGEIGRSRLDGRSFDNAYIVLQGRQCPQAITYANATLYFTNDSWIGRVSIDRSHAQPQWLNEEADTIAADASDLLWAVGGNGWSVIGRASTRGRILNRRFLPTSAGEEIFLGPTS